MADGGARLTTAIKHFVSAHACFGYPVSLTQESLDHIKPFFALYLGKVARARTDDGLFSFDSVTKYISQANVFIKSRTGGRPCFAKGGYRYMAVLGVLKKSLPKGGSRRECHILSAPQVRELVARIVPACAASIEWRTFLRAFMVLFFWGYRPGIVSWGTPGPRGDRAFDPTKDLRLRDVVFNDAGGHKIPHGELAARAGEVNWVILVLRASKGRVARTEDDGTSTAEVSTPRARSGHRVGCPVRVVLGLVLEAQRRGLHLDTPLFVQPGSDPPTPYMRTSYLKALRRAGAACGWPAERVSKLTGYSTRKGSATSFGASAGQFVAGDQAIREIILRHNNTDDALLRVYAKGTADAMRLVSMRLWFADVQGWDFDGRQSGAYLQN